MNNNVLRQIKDIQVQAERLISNKANLNEIREFSNYSKEIKLFLIENIGNHFILSKVHEIPEIQIQDSTSTKEISKNVFGYFFGVFGGLIYLLKSNKKQDEAINFVRDVKGKYGTLEFLLKNYLD